MELKGRIEAEFTLTPEESAAILQGMLAAGTATAPRTAPRTAVARTEPAPKTIPETKPQNGPETTPETAPQPEPKPAPAPAPAPQPKPAPEYKETPEQAVALLKEQFGIKPNKEDRTAEEQKKAVALNRAILALIRDITRDGSAQSLADLKCDMNRQEFIRRSMKLTYDVGANMFEESVF